MPQFALPIANQGTTNWTQGAGDGDGDWFDELDEGFGADRGSGGGPDSATTYWESPGAPVNEVITTKLAPVEPSDEMSDHVSRTRNRKGAALGVQIDITGTLYQGTTVIASATATNVGPTWTTRGILLTEAQAKNITDHADLRIETKANAVGGGAARSAHESAHELAVPNITYVQVV